MAIDSDPSRVAPGATILAERPASAGPASAEPAASAWPDAKPRRWTRSLRRWSGLALLLAVVLLAVYLVWNQHRDAALPRYDTAPATRGTLVVSVDATGNLQPTNQVDVGSELSGTIESVPVDVNDHVRKGQVLARLDVSRLTDQLASARGTLAAAEAQVALARATAEEARLHHDRLLRMERASGGTVPAKTDLDASRAALQRAVAAVASARAAVTQAQATLSAERTNLSKATIRSPIDGVVLARRIEPGQTVAASLQAPVLFTLAEDLTRMELQVDVDEADVGQVRAGQHATFTVDAYPDRIYPAQVRRVGFGSQTKDGVVSYLTVLTVDNDDLSLRPGMTASAAIVVARRTGALLVPSAALRFAPPAAADQGRDGGLVSRLIPHPPHQTRRTVPEPSTRTRTLWVLRSGRAVAVPVTVGATDGRMVEVTGGALPPGAPVIVAVAGSAP